MLSVFPILVLGCSSQFSMWGKCDSQLKKLCFISSATRIRDCLMLFFKSSEERSVDHLLKSPVARALAQEVGDLHSACSVVSGDSNYPLFPCSNVQENMYITHHLFAIVVLWLREECRTLRARRRKVLCKECCSTALKWEHFTTREAYSLRARALIWEMGDTSLFPPQWDGCWRLISYLNMKNRRNKMKFYCSLSQRFPLVKHVRWMWLISKLYKYCRNVPGIWSCKLAELLTPLFQVFSGMAHQY